MNTPTAQRDRVVEATGRDGARQFLAFRRDLYAGDPGYSTTLEFAVENVLGQTSAFTRSCFVRPLLALEDGRVVAQCILVHDPALPLLQVAFFEALPERQAAVGALLDEARAEARRRPRRCAASAGSERRTRESAFGPSTCTTGTPSWRPSAPCATSPSAPPRCTRPPGPATSPN